MSKIRSSDLRALCAPYGDPKPCYVFGCHRTITQAYHVLPLKDVARLMNEFYLDTTYEPPIVWLCPNCHTYVHGFEKMTYKVRNELESYGMFDRIYELYRWKLSIYDQRYNKDMRKVILGE